MHIDTKTNYDYQTSICLFKNKKGNTRTRYEICSKLTIETHEHHQQTSIVNGVSIVHFENISNTVLVFPVLTLIK